MIDMIIPDKLHEITVRIKRKKIDVKYLQQQLAQREFRKQLRLLLGHGKY